MPSFCAPRIEAVIAFLTYDFHLALLELADCFNSSNLSKDTSIPTDPAAAVSQLKFCKIAWSQPQLLHMQ